MTMNMSRGSAKIFEFPARGRFAVGGGRDEAKPVADLTPPRVAPTIFGGAWYHEAAVQDAEQPRKN